MSSKPTLYSRLVNESPVYYGWVVMGAAALGTIMTSPGQTYSVSIFIDYFIRELNISRGLVSTLYTVATLIGSFALPFVGRQIDRRGPRVMVVVISILFGLACIYMGFVTNAVMLGIGFIAIRMMGQGSLGIVSQNVVNRWWIRRRGTINGIKGVLVGLLGLGGFPNLINFLIPIMGWRYTYMTLGALVMVSMAIVGWLFFRNQPEDYGLEPDGGIKHRRGKAEKSDFVEVNWTQKEALKTRVFWIVALGGASIAMLSTGLFFHMVSIFRDNGLAPEVAAAVYVPIAMTTALMHFGGGVLVDRVPIRFIVALALMLQVVSLVMATALQSVWMGYVYGVVLGATSGLFASVGTVIWAKFFGRLHLGSIMGVYATITIAGSALGPMPFGIVRDLVGSYNVVLYITAIIPLILSLLCLIWVKTPQHPDSISKP